MPTARLIISSVTRQRGRKNRQSQPGPYGVSHDSSYPIAPQVLRGGAGLVAPGGSSLHLAARYGYLSTVVELLAWGADAWETDPSGKLAEELAHDGGHDLVEQYLRYSSKAVMYAHEGRQVVEEELPSR